MNERDIILDELQEARDIAMPSTETCSERSVSDVSSLDWHSSTVVRVAAMSAVPIQVIVL